MAGAKLSDVNGVATGGGGVFGTAIAVALGNEGWKIQTSAPRLERSWVSILISAGSAGESSSAVGAAAGTIDLQVG